MPKTSLDLPKFDPYALVAKAAKGALRQGEIHSLSIHIQGLERALRHRTDATIAAAMGEDIRLSLNTDMSALLVTFPGTTEHSVSCPLERPDLAMDFIVKALRERRGKTNFVGTPGAPTQADLTALAKAKPARRKIDNPSLEDLGL